MDRALYDVRAFGGGPEGEDRDQGVSMKKRLMAAAGALTAAAAISTTAFATISPGRAAVCNTALHKESAIELKLLNPNLSPINRATLEQELQVVQRMVARSCP